MTIPSMRRRLVGFMLMPAIAAVSPLLVLPLVSRIAGPSGWASAIAGEAVGTFMAIAIGYGWSAIGPALVSLADDDAARARLYRESLVVRGTISLAGLPALAVICWFVASPGAEWLTVLMGVQGALIALSFTWYCAGVGDPKTIIVFDAVPRLVAAVGAAGAIALTGVVEWYPIAGILVTAVGTSVFSARLLRRTPGPWPRLRELPRLLRSNFAVAVNDAALSAYSSIPAPLVNVTAAPIAAASYASADKLFKLGSVLPFTLASAFQSWIGEDSGRERARRMSLALCVHTGFGILGAAILIGLGPFVSWLLFGAQNAAGVDVLIAMGVVFLFLSVRTSLTRHIMFPTGGARIVTKATLIASAIGIPTMVALAILVGPLGAAIGYAATEGLATLFLIRPCLVAVRRLRMQPPPAHHERSEA